MELIEYTNYPRRVKGDLRIFRRPRRISEILRHLRGDRHAALAAQRERACGRLDFRLKPHQGEYGELETQHLPDVGRAVRIAAEAVQRVGKRGEPRRAVRPRRREVVDEAAEVARRGQRAVAASQGLARAGRHAFAQRVQLAAGTVVVHDFAGVVAVVLAEERALGPHSPLHERRDAARRRQPGYHVAGARPGADV